MNIQLPTSLVRDGMLTASGIHVVPDPILSMLTPAGPIIMSSAVWPFIPGIFIPCAIPFIAPAEVSRFSLGIPGIPAMPGMFMCAESGFDGIFGMFGIAIVGDRSFALERGLVAALPLTFFPAVDEVAL